MSVEDSKLPFGWAAVPLGTTLATLETGTRPKGGVTGIIKGVPSISAEHMTPFGDFDFTALRFIPKDFYDKMTRGHIKKNDILVVKDGATTGKTSYVDSSFPFGEAVINEHVFLVTV